ncbi:MAG: phage holin family protein [Muribaculaceae bacterium]|nr:phage holin family protein [Muribaculaceae bacterium]
MNTNSDENRGIVGAISEFCGYIKSYLGIEIAYAKITATEKLTILLSTLSISVIMLVIGAMALFYLSLSLIFSIHNLVGGYHWALLISAGCLLIIGLIVYLLRVKLIFNPIARYLSKLFLDGPTNNKKQDE